MTEFLLYIDPGSGSYLVQIIVTALLGIVFYFRNGWAWIKSLFSKNSPQKNDEKKQNP